MLNYTEFVLENENSSRFAGYFRTFLKNLMVVTDHSKTVLNEWWSFPNIEEVGEFLHDEDIGRRSMSRRKKLPNFKKELDNPIFFIFFTDFKKSMGDRHGSNIWTDEESFAALLNFRTMEIEDPFGTDLEDIFDANIPLCVEWTDGMENLDQRIREAFEKTLETIPNNIVSAARTGKKYGI